MNIIYKFTSKVSGKFYIGSKTECDIISGKIYGREGKVYYSSCRSSEFWKELKDGNIVLEVLESNVKRANIYEREAYWQKLNGFPSDKCWNRLLATDVMPYMTKEAQDRVVNVFGQTLQQVATDNSVVTRKDTAAVREGFANNGEKMFFYLGEVHKFSSYKAMDRFFGRKDYFGRLLKDSSTEDFDVKFCKLELKALMREGATFLKACELLGVKDYVVRKELGESFYTMMDRMNLVAEVNGYEERDLFNRQILKDFLGGETRDSIAKKYNNLSISTVSRVIDAEVRERLDINDI